MSGEAVQQQTPSTSGAAEGLGEYAELKKQLLARAQRAGGFVALYLFLSQGLVVSPVPLCVPVNQALYLIFASCDPFCVFRPLCAPALGAQLDICI